MKPLNLLLALWLVAVGCAQAQSLPAEVRAEASVEGITAYRLNNGLQLLLVEDDATVAEVVGGLLEAQGHQVVRAGNGLNALAEAMTGAFDLALLDLDLPGIDGLTLARMLREQGYARPIIAVTARADAEAEPLARDAGFNGFLRKPLTGAMLAEAIEAALAEPASIQRRTDEAR